MSVTQLRLTDNMCPTCATRPRAGLSAWCVDCTRERKRAHEARRRERKRAGLGLVMPQRSRRNKLHACNCKTPECDGLRCDSLRYGTAGSRA
jgi:hypothetical protein